MKKDTQMLCINFGTKKNEDHSFRKSVFAVLISASIEVAFFLYYYKTYRLYIYNLDEINQSKKKNTDTCNIRYCMDQTRFKNDIH